MQTINPSHIRVHIDNKAVLQYTLGGLLYTPAIRGNTAEIILNRKYAHLHALALCLEDSIQESAVEDAERQLEITFAELERAVDNDQKIAMHFPSLFVRVRAPEQISRVYDRIGQSDLLTGFILPKFDSTNAEKYISELNKINALNNKPVYAMPIIESGRVLDIMTRQEELKAIKSAVDSISDLILNVRVGGNDFCNVYGLRRHIDRTIYDISVIRSVLTDIVNVFGIDYVVSGPVWEYFSNGTDNRWETGLRNELRMDRLNGFIGKTAIHPSQLHVIDDEMKVIRSDYQDALNIVNWDSNTLGVSKSNGGNRMNEQKVHLKWAEKTLILASIYGIREDIVQ